MLREEGSWKSLVKNTYAVYILKKMFGTELIIQENNKYYFFKDFKEVSFEKLGDIKLLKYYYFDDTELLRLKDKFNDISYFKK